MGLAGIYETNKYPYKEPTQQVAAPSICVWHLGSTVFFGYTLRPKQSGHPDYSELSCCRFYDALRDLDVGSECNLLFLKTTLNSLRF